MRWRQGWYFAFHANVALVSFFCHFNRIAVCDKSGLLLHARARCALVYVLCSRRMLAFGLWQRISIYMCVCTYIKCGWIYEWSVFAQYTRVSFAKHAASEAPLLRAIMTLINSPGRRRRRRRGERLWGVPVEEWIPPLWSACSRTVIWYLRGKLVCYKTFVPRRAP